MNKKNLMSSIELDAQGEESFVALDKAQMDALRKKNPKNFSSINGWSVIGLQVGLSLMATCFGYLFGESSNKTVYTYSAFVGGLIGFLPSALFLARLELAKKNVKSSPGGYLTAVVSGEFIKILATIFLFLGFAISLPNLKWIPLLVTYLATLTCYLLVGFGSSKQLIK